MFHVELRRNLEHVCRFNMSEQTLLSSILVPWASGRPIELGERSWRPDETTVTVLEGPEIPIGGLTMSRGWPTALRQGMDVTETVVASVRQSLAARARAAKGDGLGGVDGVLGAGVGGSDTAVAGEPGGGGGAAVGAGLGGGGSSGPVGGSGRGGASDQVLADAFGLELLRNLRDDALTLHAAWRLAGERHPELAASDSLALAMNAVLALLRSGLAMLVEGETGEALELGGEDLEAKVRAMDGWLADVGAGALEIRRR